MTLIVMIDGRLSLYETKYNDNLHETISIMTVSIIILNIISFSIMAF